jgi:hypothetical protein
VRVRVSGGEGARPREAGRGLDREEIGRGQGKWEGKAHDRLAHGMDAQVRAGGAHEELGDAVRSATRALVWCFVLNQRGACAL